MEKEKLAINREKLQKISKLRVKESKVLLDSGLFEGSYYLLGYAVECALKACIAKKIKRFDFPDKQFITDSYTHNLERLLELAELKEKLVEATKNNPALGVNWAIVKDWAETHRYKEEIPELTARNFFSACTARKHGVLSWIKKWW